MVLKLNDDDRHICTNGPDDGRLGAIVFCIVLITDEILWITNFVEQHLVPYEYLYVSISLVVIEASMWLL